MSSHTAHCSGVSHTRASVSCLASVIKNLVESKKHGNEAHLNFGIIGDAGSCPLLNSDNCAVDCWGDLVQVEALCMNLSEFLEGVTDLIDA